MTQTQTEARWVLDITIEATQPLLGVRDRDGRAIETLADMQARLEAMEQALRDLRGE